MPQSWPFLARPPIQSRSGSGLRYPLENAGVAQLAEQLFCKQMRIEASCAYLESSSCPGLHAALHSTNHDAERGSRSPEKVSS